MKKPTLKMHTHTLTQTHTHTDDIQLGMDQALFYSSNSTKFSFVSSFFGATM